MERATVGAVFQFRRKPTLWQRLPKAPAWSPLLALVGMAAILVAMSEFRPNAFGGFVEPRSSALGESTFFRLCRGSQHENCVIDGDTIRYAGAKIRIADIDAPETHDPRCASEAALGARATRRLLGLMNAGPFEVVRAGSRDLDTYGRELRIIQRDGRSITDVMVAEGLARRWDGARHPWCN
jgi:micrococcal nuclease